MIKPKRLSASRRFGAIAVAAVLLCALPPRANAAVGEIAADFTLPVHTNNSESIRLSDFAGKIVLLEFFYHWCPHCQAATPDIKRNIHDYYASRGGTLAGIPVVTLYINMSEDVAETDDFIRANRLDLVADDINCSPGDIFDCEIYERFGGDGTPHLVVINASTNSEVFSQWEIVYVSSGYAARTTVPALRRAIDSIAIPPAVRINSPRRNAKVTEPVITARGTATDNVGVTEVFYRLAHRHGVDPVRLAAISDDSRNWSATVDLVPGSNVLEVGARDGKGNVSPLASVLFSYITQTPLTLTVAGSGRVAPNLDGRLLVTGQSYTLQAVPSLDQVFSHWSGGINSGAARATFLMESNLAVQANFIPSPFRPVTGSYNGLFAPAAAVRHADSGAVTLLVRASGAYSGRLDVGGRRYGLSGLFFADGTSTNTVKRRGSTDLTVELALDLVGGTGRLTGRVVDSDPDAGWTASLRADLAPVYGRGESSPFRGSYTVVIPASVEAGLRPGGDGFGSAVVNAQGRLSFKGVLGDGTAVSQSAPLSKDGAWPFYAPLYGGKGGVWSRVSLSNPPPATVLAGDLTWINPGSPRSRLYPLGFTNASVLAGASYVRPTTGKVMDIDLAIVEFRGGNLPGVITNAVRLGADNKVVPMSGEPPLALSINLVSGLFSGRVTVMEEGGGRLRPRNILYKGALLQPRRFGSGHFVNGDQTGRVSFGE